MVALDPLGDVAEEHKLYQVSFLSAEPDPRGGGEDRAGRLRPGALRACGARDLRMAPGGIHNSRLARMLSDKRLGVVATARNWKTTTKLLEMADDHERSA